MKPHDDEFYLYFIIRSMVSGLVGAATFAAVMLSLNVTNPVHAVAISVANFFLALFVSRLFDGCIRRFVDCLLKMLDAHPGARKFLLKNF